METKKAVKIAVALSTIVTFISLNPMILGLLTSSVQIGNTGTIKAVGVGVYWNSACTNTTTSLPWGKVDPGSNKTFTVYVKNVANTAETLSLSTSNWSPTQAATYMTLSWNYTAGTGLNPGQVMKLGLKLSVSSSITGIDTFSFTVVITGTEKP